MTCNPDCYTCGHALEEHCDEYAECEVDGCGCAYFEESECEEEEDFDPESMDLSRDEEAMLG